ncbi:MAG TPA: XRE family transcriptional regulator [Terriglobales bacterium]|nr:XRE family transcriptional regulator [Terriglobales bacterium]
MPVSPTGRPDWAKKIEEMRERLDLSQAALAKKLNVSAMAPSRWERGINRPPSSVFLRLGKLIGHPLCWYFWEQAGLSKEDVFGCTDPAEFEELRSKAAGYHVVSVLDDTKSDKQQKDKEFVALPLLPPQTRVFEVQSTKTKQGGEGNVMLAKRDWCPNPEHTVCWQYRGTGMKPLIADASIVAIDLTKCDPESLVGKMVLASHEKHGPRVKWLKRTSEGLSLQPENPDADSFSVKKDQWSIAGRVIWWFRKTDQ